MSRARRFDKVSMINCYIGPWSDKMIKEIYHFIAQLMRGLTVRKNTLTALLRRVHNFKGGIKTIESLGFKVLARWIGELEELVDSFREGTKPVDDISQVMRQLSKAIDKIERRHEWHKKRLKSHN